MYLKKAHIAGLPPNEIYYIIFLYTDFFFVFYFISFIDVAALLFVAICACATAIERELYVCVILLGALVSFFIHSSFLCSRLHLFLRLIFFIFSSRFAFLLLYVVSCRIHFYVLAHLNE